jgi:hypothetical protein
LGDFLKKDRLRDRITGYVNQPGMGFVNAEMVAGALYHPNIKSVNAELAYQARIGLIRRQGKGFYSQHNVVESEQPGLFTQKLPKKPAHRYEIITLELLVRAGKHQEEELRLEVEDLLLDGERARFVAKRVAKANIDYVEVNATLFKGGNGRVP